jgi:glycosyltransferase involved in cell wall biosynthesis
MNRTSAIPRVSVVLPVRDGAAFIVEAVQSILRQTLTDFELLIIDDGSADGTPTLLAAMATGNAQLRVLRQDGLGLVPALNRGLAEARALYVARMDADDVAWPERLERQATFLDSAPTVALVGSAYRVIGPDGAARHTLHPPQSAAEVSTALERGNCIAHPSVMLRRDAVLACGGYRPAFRRAEDFDLWLRLRERHALVNLPDTLLDYRAHPAQSAWQALEQRILSEMGALAAAARRAEGVEDGASGSAPIDRTLLRALGVDDAAISNGIIARALGAAKNALSAGNPIAARSAVVLALRQPTLQPRTRVHLRLLAVRAGLRRTLSATWR